MLGALVLYQFAVDYVLGHHFIRWSKGILFPSLQSVDNVLILTIFDVIDSLNLSLHRRSEFRTWQRIFCCKQLAICLDFCQNSIPLKWFDGGLMHLVVNIGCEYWVEKNILVLYIGIMLSFV